MAGRYLKVGPLSTRFGGKGGPMGHSGHSGAMRGTSMVCASSLWSDWLQSLFGRSVGNREKHTSGW